MVVRPVTRRLSDADTPDFNIFLEIKHKNNIRDVAMPVLADKNTPLIIAPLIIKIILFRTDKRLIPRINPFGGQVSVIHLLRTHAHIRIVTVHELHTPVRPVNSLHHNPCSIIKIEAERIYPIAIKCPFSRQIKHIIGLVRPNLHLSGVCSRSHDHPHRAGIVFIRAHHGVRLRPRHICHRRGEIAFSPRGGEINGKRILIIWVDILHIYFEFADDVLVRLENHIPDNLVLIFSICRKYPEIKQCTEIEELHLLELIVFPHKHILCKSERHAHHRHRSSVKLASLMGLHKWNCYALHRISIDRFPPVSAHIYMEYTRRYHVYTVTGLHLMICSKPENRTWLGCLYGCPLGIDNLPSLFQRKSESVTCFKNEMVIAHI